MQEDFDYEQLPYSMEAEQSVLGAMLLDSSCIAEVFSYVKADNFYREQNKRLFSVLSSLFIRNLPIDFVTVLNAVISENIFTSEDDAKLYLTHIMDLVPSISNVSSYCKIVREKYYLRSLIVTSREIINLAAISDSDAEKILDSAEQRIFEIRQGRASFNLISLTEGIGQEFDYLDRLATGQIKSSVSSGYIAIDSILTGLNASDLIVLAARPAMGKTSLALNIATRVAKHSEKKVVVFSLEMSVQQLVERMLSSECSISSKKLHSGMLENEDWALLAAGADELSKCNIYFDDDSSLSVAEMKAKLRRFSDVGLVVIDYLQLMSTGQKTGNRVQEISEITRMLKIMAKDLDVPVIVISQLARSPETRQDHRPILSDLRESGSIEQDADVVMFLYRDEYYNPEQAKPGIAECIIAKNRHGETGVVELSFEGRYTRFVGLDKFHSEE